MAEVAQPNAERMLRSFALLLIVVVISIPIRGYVLARLWEWFITRATGWHPISTALASGIVITVMLLRGKAKDSDTTIVGPALAEVAFWLISLGFGWVILQWVQATK